MRNRQLHDALRAFALEAAALLRDDQAAGQELGFELDEGHRRGGPALYHYRPLTREYIADRWHRLRCLPSVEDAALALDSGAAAYLRLNGMRGAEAEPALRAMLERLYDELSDFAFPEERFERVYSEVEGTLYEKSQSATVLVPVYGLEMEADRVDLGEGLALVRGDSTDAPDEAVWGDPSDPDDEAAAEPNALLMLERDVAPDDPLPLADAREGFRRLLHGLRLFKPGGIALSAVAWRRTGDGRWQPFQLETTGQARGAPWILVDGEEAELVQFLDAVARPPRTGPVAWALSRFQMGTGRRLEAEALTDYLLALRALIDEGESNLALRVAVLCAEENERRRVQRRIELAQAMERFVIGDGADEDYMDAVGHRFAADAGRGGGAPPARAAARRAVRLPGRRPAPGGGRAAAGPAGALRDPGRVAEAHPPRARAAARARGAPARTSVQAAADQLEGQLGLDEAEYWSAPV